MKLNYRILSDDLFFSTFDNLNTLIYAKLFKLSYDMRNTYFSSKKENIVDILNKTHKFINNNQKNYDNYSEIIEEKENNTKCNFSSEMINEYKDFINYKYKEILFNFILKQNPFNHFKKIKINKYFKIISKIYFNSENERIKKMYTPNCKYENDGYTLEYFTIHIPNIEKDLFEKFQNNSDETIKLLKYIREIFNYDQFGMSYYKYMENTHEEYDINFEPTININFVESTYSIIFLFGMKVSINGIPLLLSDPYQCVENTEPGNKNYKNIMEMLTKVSFPYMNTERFKDDINSSLKKYKKIIKILNKK